MIVTSSAIRTWNRCRKEYSFRYVECIVPTEKRSQLAIGSAVHAGLESLWRGNPVEQALALTEQAMQGMDVYLIAQAMAMVSVYAERYPYLAQNWIEVSPEVEFAFQVGHFERRFQASGSGVLSSENSWTYWPPSTSKEPILLAGKIDVLATQESGRHVIYEHKTTSESLDAPIYWARLRMDLQCAIYTLAGSFLVGKLIDEVIYDVLKKPTVKPHRATPVEQRKYTKAKTAKCHACIGGLPTCAVCHGAGVVITSPSRLYQGQTEEGEDPSAYAKRCVEQLSQQDFYRRALVPLRVEHLRKCAEEIVTIAKEMASAPATPNYDACFRMGHPCPYFPICSNAELPGQFERRMPYEELPGLQKELQRYDDPKLLLNTGATTKEERA